MGDEAFGQSKYLDARVYYSKIADKDTTIVERITFINNTEKYEKGLADMKRGDLDMAINTLSQVSGFKNSDKLRGLCENIK